MSFLPCPRTARTLRSYHLMWEVMVLRLRIAAPSLRHKHIDRYIYMCMYKYAYVCVYIYIYICMYKFGPGVDSGSQPLSANKNKRINPSTAHLLITKPHAQSPLHAHPRKKKLLFSLSGKIKMLLSHLLIQLHPSFCSLFNWSLTSLHRQSKSTIYCDLILFRPIVIHTCPSFILWN